MALVLYSSIDYIHNRSIPNCLQKEVNDNF